MAEDQAVRKLVEQACVDWETDLRCFLLGVLRDRHQADDALQRTMLRAIQAADSANSRNLRGWLFRIALNEARQLRRAEHREAARRLRVAERQSGEWFAGALTEMETQLLTADMQIRIRQALARLSADYRWVVQRRIYDGQPFAEIAAERQLPLGTVLTWMRRALLQLKEDQELKDFI